MTDSYNDELYVSVIVPVYNTENYLKQCLESLKNQTLGRIEIIIVDDGSTDDSANICDIFASHHENVLVVHKQNEGLAAARNVGLDMARAKYVMFVDSDDWVEPDFCEEPFQVAEYNDADIVIFRSTVFGRLKAKKNKPFPIEGVIPKDIILSKMWDLTGNVAWNKLYRRKLFDDIRYPIGRFSEDTAVTHRLVYSSRKTILLNKYLYNYRDYRPESITNKRSYSSVLDYLYFSFKFVDDLKSWGYNYTEKEKSIALSYLAAMGTYAEWSEKCERIINECCDFKINTSWKQKAMFHIFKLSPILFDYISIVTGRRVRRE